MRSRDEYDALRREAEALFEADDWGPAAISVYERMIVLDGRNEWAYCRLASCHEKAGDFDEARRIYEHVRRFSPRSNCAGRGLEHLDGKTQAAAEAAALARRPDEIRALVEGRRIDFLYHFTRADNLNSIFETGIRSQAALRLAGATVVINDEARWDGYPEASCLSIGFPNYKLFHVFGWNNPGTTWAVLAIQPSVLWDLDCAFFSTNAASNSMRFQPRKKRSDPFALTEMFVDPCANTGTARFPGLPAYYTTDPQAEVLVFDAIPPECIAGACFETDAARTSCAIAPELCSRMFVNDSCFRNRIDCDLWW